MNTKEMRAKLREAGKRVPRSNEELIEVFNEAFGSDNTQFGLPEKKPEETTAPVLKLASNNVFTYIGAGDTPPHMIDFMGLQKFIRGQATPVDNPVVIQKILNHPCFVRGEVDKDVMFENDEAEKKKAEIQRDKDTALQIEIDRINRA